MPEKRPTSDDPAAVRDMLINAGFTADAADRLLTGPVPEPRRPVPLVENKGRVEGLLPGGGSTGRHTSTRGSVDGDRR